MEVSKSYKLTPKSYFMILIVNIGSASKKYALYEKDKQLFSAHFERGLDHSFMVSFKHGSVEEEYTVSEGEYKEALSYTLCFLMDKELISGENNISKAGVRVVAPGEYFTEHRAIDREYIKRLEKASGIVPLHIVPVLAELKKLKKLLPDIPVVGISDSAFHRDMPDVGRRYALPKDVTEKYGIYRYGYHGLSVASAVAKMKTYHGGVPRRTIVCHLGSGASITALLNGKSIDTSMGFTPLEGVPMGSRSGTIDTEAALFIAKTLGFSSSGLSFYLNTKSGLTGLSGGFSDIRKLLMLREEGNSDARFALELFAYRIREHIGAYIAALGGLDALAFTGTIGEHAPKIRKDICEPLRELGILLDEHENSLYAGDKDGFIQKASSPVKIFVLVSEEMKEIAQTALGVE